MRRLAGIGATVASLVLAAGSAHAALLTDVSYESQILGTTGGADTLQTVMLGSSSNDLVFASDPLGLGFASGLTDYRIHKAVVDTTSTGDYPDGVIQQSQATVRSRWEDQLTLGGGTGQGTAIVNIAIDGSLSTAGVNPSHQASASLQFIWGGVSMSWLDNARDCPTCPVISDNATFVNGVLSAPFLFDYGTSYTIISEFVLVGSFGGDGKFGDTVTLTIAVPDGAILTAASGTDYTAVPEPATWLLLGTGLGGVLLTRMRHGRPADAEIT